MKKFLSLASICLALTFTSCEDFLSVSSPDELTTGNYWRDESDALAGLASAYSQLYHGDTYATSEVRWPTEEYRADIVNLGRDAGNYDQWVALYNFTYTNGNTQMSYYYQDLYRGINFANQVIANVPNIPAEEIDESARNTILEEAHFLRGYYHLMLLLNWEKIIIRDEYITETAQLNKPLSERNACWDFVISELEQATGLPTERTVEELGRATSGAAYAYIGLAYLTRAYEETTQKDTYLTEAANALRQVINSGAYSLVSGENLINMFNGTNKNCSESIFEVQYSASEANGSVHYSYINQWIGATELGGWDEILPSDMLMEEYMKEGIKADGLYDNRLYNTIYYQCDYFNDGTGNVLGGHEYNDLFCEFDDDGNPKPGTEYNRPVFRKFTSPTQEEMWESCDFNIPLMRYSNVLLMMAETLNEQGQTSEAIPYINEVRTVHGGMEGIAENSSYDAVKAQIEHERILEFPLEGYRWFDMRRWGVTAERLQAAGRTGYDDSKAFYPIPKWETDANPEAQQ